MTNITKNTFTSDIEGASFEQKIFEKLGTFFGKPADELYSQFQISTNNKSKNSQLISAILGISGNANSSKEFIEHHTILKTIRIEENNSIREHMSFPTFSFIELSKENWENSSLRQFFLNSRFLFVVFKKIKGIYYLEKIKFWKMPLLILDGPVKDTWSYTKDLIINGDIVKTYDGKKYTTNFPGSTYNEICHVRPHDSLSIEKGKGAELPFPDKLTGITRYTKHCFWLDSKYISNIIND